jgi:hypothetical protein
MRAQSLCGVLLAVFLLATISRGEGRRHEHASVAAEGGTLMNLGAGFLIGGGSAAPGVGVSLSTRITSRAPVYLGVDTGSYFYSSPFAWILPIMPMVKYLFYGNTPFVPTLGLSMGPVFGIGSGASAVSFGMLFKPGIQFNVNHDFDISFEPRLGVIGSNFIFDPEISALFHI